MSNTGVRSFSSPQKGDIPHKLSNAFLFETTNRDMHGTALNLLRQEVHSIVPKVSGSKRLEQEFKRYAPIVTVNDLTKGEGDEVEVKVYHDLSGEGTYCCDKLQGTGEEMTYSSFKVGVGIKRKAVKQGCAMNQLYNGKTGLQIARPALSKWMAQHDSESAIYHLAGARGHHTHGKRRIPLDYGKNSAFSKAMVNCVTPPTACRHVYANEIGGNGAGSVDGVDGNKLMGSDEITLELVTNLRYRNEDSDHPILPIKLDQGGDEFWLLAVTPAQMLRFRNSPDGRRYQELQAQALERGKGCGNHPLFKGDCFVWDNILVKKYEPSVGFLPGQKFMVSNRDDSCDASVRTTMLDADADFQIDRALFIGGQALAEAIATIDLHDGKGSITNSNTNYTFTNETWDHGMQHEIGVAGMAGMKKIVIEDENGCKYDRGVMAVDSAVALRKSATC